MRLEIQIFLISFHQVRFWTEKIFSHFGSEILKWEYFFSLPKWDLQKILSVRLFRSEIFQISSRCEITWTSLIRPKWELQLNDISPEFNRFVQYNDEIPWNKRCNQLILHQWYTKLDGPWLFKETVNFKISFLFDNLDKSVF